NAYSLLTERYGHMKTPWMKLAAIGAGSLLAMTACSPSAQEDTADAEDADSDTITVGIKYDQPGLGFREGDNDPTGFDVDVAKAVLSEMGYEEEQIEWEESPTPQRENMLENGQVDMIFATYSITEERAERVDFAGPYFMAGQDILVRAHDQDIIGSYDLNGGTPRSVCWLTDHQKRKYI